MQITVNGEVREIASEPDTPLLWVLRDELGLTGTKFGCGIASCGACTVHVDGQAVRSCVLPVSAVSGAVTTIEGLAGATASGRPTDGDASGAMAGEARVAEAATDTRAAVAEGATEGAASAVSPDDAHLHSLQRAWIERQVAQCGYCQSGQIMSAAALLAADPAPSDETIERAMAGNLCRCGTYPRIRAAIRSVADGAAADGEAEGASSTVRPAPDRREG